MQLTDLYPFLKVNKDKNISSVCLNCVFLSLDSICSKNNDLKDKSIGWNCKDFVLDTDNKK